MRLLIVSVAAATLALAACKKENHSEQPTDITSTGAPSTTTEVQLPAAPEATAPAASTTTTTTTMPSTTSTTAPAAGSTTTTTTNTSDNS